MRNKCEFCGRPSSEARFMVKGPDGKNLCSDCISVVIFNANKAMLSMDNIKGGGGPWKNTAAPEEDFEDIFGEDGFPFDADAFEDAPPFPAVEPKPSLTVSYIMHTACRLKAASLCVSVMD